MDKIIQGEADGYRKALLMIQDNIDGIFSECKRFKLRMNSKQMHNIINAIIKERQLLRDNPFAFVRYNIVKNEWEIVVDKRYE